MSPQRNIMVLGANSFSGQDFVDLLLDDPANRVVGVSRSPERSAAFARNLNRRPPAAYQYVQLDMNRQMPQLLSLLDAERPDWIVNFAALSEVARSWQHPEHWFQTNCVALADLINHLRQRDYPQRYLHVSTPEVYGTCEGNVDERSPLNPSTPYAASKAAADLLLRTYREHYGLPLLTVRATNVYGARQQLFKIIPRSVIYLKLGRTIPLHGGGTAQKSFLHIRDVSRGELAILQHGELGEIYHLSPATGIRIRDVVRAICERRNRSFDESVAVVEERLGQDAAYVIDSTKARTTLGWSPQIDFETGIAEVIQWVETNWDEIRQRPLEYQHVP